MSFLVICLGGCYCRIIKKLATESLNLVIFFQFFSCFPLSLLVTYSSYCRKMLDCKQIVVRIIYVASKLEKKKIYLITSELETFLKLGKL